MKTVKPNKDSFKEFKRMLLTWVATYAYQNQNTNIHTLSGKNLKIFQKNSAIFR